MQLSIRRNRIYREIRFEETVWFVHGMFHGFEELWEIEQSMMVVGPLPRFELDVGL